MWYEDRATETKKNFLKLVPVEAERDPSNEENDEATWRWNILRKTLKEVSEKKETLQAEVNSLKEALTSEKEKERCVE